MTTAALSRSGLFADELFSSTELSRKTGEVLNHARSRPVTISRNGEQFALLRREQAAGLVMATDQFGPILDLVQAALCVVENRKPPTAFEWLKAFDLDDIRKMLREVVISSANALRQTNDWDEVNSIIHAWHESALVATSGVLDEAMNSPADELLSPLSDPRKLVEADSEKELVGA